MPVLVGFVPGVAVAVSSVPPPATTLFGFADPVTVGFVGGTAVIVNEIVPVPVRNCASVMVAFNVLPPGDVAGSTVAVKVNVLSLAVASPCPPPGPSSKKVCVADPPIGLRSTVTASPVLAGFMPGVTATVSTVELPACTAFGVAKPVPVGLVGPAAMPRMEISSIARACALVVVVPLVTE